MACSNSSPEWNNDPFISVFPVPDRLPFWTVAELHPLPRFCGLPLTHGGLPGRVPTDCFTLPPDPHRKHPVRYASNYAKGCGRLYVLSRLSVGDDFPQD